ICLQRRATCAASSVYSPAGLSNEVRSVSPKLYFCIKTRLYAHATEHIVQKHTSTLSLFAVNAFDAGRFPGKIVCPHNPQARACDRGFRQQLARQPKALSSAACDPGLMRAAVLSRRLLEHVLLLA